MKRIIAIAIASVGLAAGSLAYANHPGMDGKHWEKRLDNMKTELSLTDAQVASIKKIFEATHEKMKALHEETQKGISDVLTAEQKVKFEAMKEMHHDHKSKE